VADLAQASNRPIRIPSVHAEDLFTVGGAATSALGLAWVAYWNLAPDPGIAGFVLVWFVAFAFMYWLATRRILGSLFASDRLIAVLISAGALVMLAPLVLVISFVAYKGFAVLTPHFFTETAEFCGQLNGATCGGVSHAIVGTLEQVGIAMVVAVPLAVLCAVFLNEIGGPMARPVRLFVDAMSGVPSIVAGLFIYAVWVVGLQKGFSGFAASLALAILMLPTITRTAEVVLRLVPDGLREGSLALGGTEWRTVWLVVLPTARSGLITAVILGVARAVGETAPLILTAFGASVMNANPFSGSQEALPYYVYEYIRFNPGTGPYQRAWAAAAVLTGLVLALFTLARLLGSLTSIEGRQARATRRTLRPVVVESGAAGMSVASVAGSSSVPALREAARSAAAGPAGRSWRRTAAAAAAVPILASALYGGGGLIYAQVMLANARTAYAAVVNDENQTTDAFNALATKLTASPANATTTPEQAKASVAQFVKQAEDARAQAQSDDATLAGAEANLRQYPWLTPPSASAIDSEVTRIGHLRKVLADAGVILSDLVRLGSFYGALADVSGNVVDLGNLAKAHDIKGALAAAATLKTNTDLAITRDTAPGLPGDADKFLHAVRDLAVDYTRLLAAIQAGDNAGATTANQSVQADTTRLQAFDTSKWSASVNAFYKPLIDAYDSEVASANAE